MLKYRNIAKKGRKTMEAENVISNDNNYGLEVTITEKPRSPSPCRNRDIFGMRASSPQFKNKAYESYFLSLEEDAKTDSALLGRVSFAPNTEIERNLDNYSRKLSLTRQQLSLVEEESTQDLESIPSQNMRSLSPKISCDNEKVDKNMELFVDKCEVIYPKTNSNYIKTSDNYSNFYNDFHTLDSCKSKLSSTGIHTDTSSKDSGYADGGLKENKLGRDSLPRSPLPKKSIFVDKHNLPKSLDYPVHKEDYDPDKTWAEPLSHSRLLYKDFFLKRPDSNTIPPQNSPTKSDVPISEINEHTVEKADENQVVEYPTYLLNSTTKAYTSKVIEDYKRELEAINNLHELTLKDIKTDAVSPTPLNIDELFEQNKFSEDKRGSSENSQETNLSDIPSTSDKNSLDTKRDVSKVTTKELIQNYLKVKGDCTKDMPRNLRKYDKKLNNINSKFEENSSYKQFWNNRNAKSNISKNGAPGDIRQQNNTLTCRVPLSARIDSVQNDKDIESWMSLSIHSPRLLETDNFDDKSEEPAIQMTSEKPTVINKITEIESKVESPTSTKTSPQTPKSKELNAKSSVLDIYSMLKEIESYGDNPVTSVVSTNVTAEPEVKEEERCNTPKDNFM